MNSFLDSFFGGVFLLDALLVCVGLAWFFNLLMDALVDFITRHNK